MTEIEIDAQPWRVLRSLLLLDRWTSARSWPQPWRAGDPDPATVNAVERALAALLTNPATRGALNGVLALDPAREPRDLVGEGPDPDLLRRGEAGLSLLLDHHEGRNRLSLEWPGFIRPWAERIREPLPRRIGGADLVLGVLRLDPLSARSGGSLGWRALPAGLALVAHLTFDASDVEVLAPWTLDWKRVELDVRLFPDARGERLLWRYDVALHLEPAGPLEAEISARVRDALLDQLEAWGPVLTGALLAFPLRPVPEPPAFASIAGEALSDLGSRLANALYPVALLPDGLASALIGAALIPANPARAVAAWVSDGALRTEAFPARLADHFVRHTERPRAFGRPEEPRVRFHVEPIRNDAGTALDLTDPVYGHWAPTSATDDHNRARGECVVLREQLRLSVDHLTIPERSTGGVPPGSGWTLEWRARVRHRRLDGNRWATVGTWTTVPAVDGRTVTVGPPGVRTAWSEVRGELSVVGTLRANGVPVSWFDVGTTMLDHGPSGIGASDAALGLLPERNGAQPPAGLAAEHRAGAVVRAEQQTSLVRSMLDRLTLRVARVHLTRPGPLGATGPFAALFVDLRVNGRTAGRRRLSPEEYGDVRALRLTTIGGPTTDVYVSPTDPDGRLDVVVVLLGADGDTVTDLASAAFTLRRDDPDAPSLRWGVHPGLGTGPIVVRSGELQVRVDVTDRHFRGDDVAHEDQVRAVEVFVQQVEVLEPTEPGGANLGAMHYEATFSSTLDAATLAEVGPVTIGPLGTPTGPATPTAPILLPHAVLAVHGGGEGIRLPAPPGARLRVFVRGEERAWWLPNQALGAAASERSYAADEQVDGVPALNPAKVGWTPSDASSPGGYFRFTACAVGSPPPDPLLRVAGTTPLGPAQELDLPAGASLGVTYACVPWATALVLQRRPRGGDEDSWAAEPSPALAVGETSQASVVLPASGRWRYRLRADSEAGASYSPLLRVRIV